MGKEPKPALDNPELKPDSSPTSKREKKRIEKAKGKGG